MKRPTAAEAAAVAKAADKLSEKSELVTITPPKFKTIQVRIVGEAPYVQLRFSKKAEILAKQQEGSTAKSRKRHEPKDVQKLFKEAQHLADAGWCGIPCAAFRNAMIDACRLVGFKMVSAKMAIFVESDGLDANEKKPLVRITKGSPKLHIDHGRNANGGMDIRIRAMFETWECRPRIRFDGDMFRTQDVVNLLLRAGAQVGVGEGRAFSRESAGQGWGFFRVELEK